MQILLLSEHQHLFLSFVKTGFTVDFIQMLIGRCIVTMVLQLGMARCATLAHNLWHYQPIIVILCRGEYVLYFPSQIVGPYLL